MSGNRNPKKNREDNSSKSQNKKVKKEGVHTTFNSEHFTCIDDLKYDKDHKPKDPRLQRYQDMTISSRVPPRGSLYKEIIILTLRANQQVGVDHSNITFAVLRKIKKAQRNNSNFLVLYDFTNGEELFSLRLTQNLIYCDFNYHPDKQLLSHQSDNRIILYHVDLVRYRLVPAGNITLCHSILSLTRARESFLLCYTDNHRTLCVDIRTKRIIFKIHHEEIEDWKGGYPFHVFLPDRDAFIVVQPGGSLAIYSFYGRNLLKLITLEESITAVTYCPKRQILILGLYKLFEHSKILSIDMLTFEEKAAAITKDRCIFQIDIDTNTEFLLVWFSSAIFQVRNVDDLNFHLSWYIGTKRLVHAEILKDNNTSVVLGDDLLMIEFSK